jgi:hypothetical protein
MDALRQVAELQNSKFISMRDAVQSDIIDPLLYLNQKTSCK